LLRKEHPLDVGEIQLASGNVSQLHPIPRDVIQCLLGRALRAPRIISNFQGLYGHKNAAEEAAEQENLLSTVDEIA
jgi:hypothetical protein